MQALERDRPTEDPETRRAPRPDLDDGAAGDAFVCARCGARIASASARVEIGGAHEHTFMNPGGFVFTIRCLSGAPGCAPAGEESAEWSWFPGHVWRVAVCRSCWTHLGWSFRSSGNAGASFHGLIVDRIVLDRSDAAP